MKLPVPLTRNLRLKALATSLSLGTWIAVVYSGNPPETRSITVHVPQEAAAIPARFVLMHPIPDIALRMHGTRDNLSSFDPASITVSAAFAVISRPGITAVPLTVTNRDPDVDMDPPPASLEVEVDSLASASKTVQIFFDPPPPRGYIVSPGVATPAQIVVTGPEREVSGITVSLTVDMGQQKTNVDEQAPVVLQLNGHRVTDVGLNMPTVRVNAVVTQSATSRASAVVPRTTGLLALGRELGGISVDPPTVTLAGSQDLLNGLDSVPTTPIDLTGSGGDHVMTVKIITPVGVTASPDTVTVHIRVTTLPASTAQPTLPTPPAPAPATPTPTPTPSPPPIAPTP